MNVYNYILSSSSDDENFRRPRRFKERKNYLEELDEIEFKVRFRLNKETV